MRTLGLTTLCALALAATACSPFDPELGDSPFRCGTSEPRCPEGYACEEDQGSTGVCVREGDTVDPMADSGPAGNADAGPLVCNNDSAIEPNNAINAATTTPIPDQATEYTLVGLAICPAGDVDVFRLRVDVNGKNITATASETVRSRGELVVEILNGTGVPIATGNYDAGGTAVTAVVNNAPTGTYFVQIRGVDGATQNNYNRIFIQTTGP
jgi:hypothetical protein